MTQTHTSQWYDVSNGGTVSYTVPSERTLQSNVEIRFRGEEKETTSNVRKKKENISSEELEYQPGEDWTFWSDYPSPPSDASDVEYDAVFTQGNKTVGGNTAGFSYRIDYDTGNKTGSVNVDEGATNDGYTTNNGVDNVSAGDTVSGTFENTDDETGTTEFFVIADVQWTETQTTIEQTENPSATLRTNTNGYSGTLNDGDTTSWLPLSGFQEGDNVFSFTIDGSNQASFRFRYDYKGSPTPIGYMAIGQQDGTRTLLPLADPNDSALVYNDERVPLSDGTIAAEDLVDPSDPDATNVRVVRSDGSIAAWRRDNFGGSP